MAWLLRKYKHSKKWYARIKPPSGTWGNWKSTGQTNKKLAQRVAEQWDAAAITGEEAVTLEQAFQLLAHDLIRKKRSESTLKMLEAKAKNVCDRLGHERIVSTLTLGDYESYLDRRRDERVKDATVAKELGYLSQSLRRLKKLKLYHGDVEELWPEALARTFKGRTRWLTRDEYVQLRDRIFPYWRDHLIIYVNTGVRFSELYSLRIEDVRGHMLHVRGTKTEGANRKVALNTEALETLRRRAASSIDGALFEIRSSKRWCEPSLDSQKRSWLRALGVACKKLGFEHASTNDCRRTFASWCWHSGIDIQTVILWMGHGSDKMCKEVYQQPSDEHSLQEMQKFPQQLRVTEATLH